MASSGHNDDGERTPRIPAKRVRLLYEHRISIYSLFVALPGLGVSLILIWRQPWLIGWKFALFALELSAWWLLVRVLHQQTVRPLQTLANVVAALRAEDYSFRARGAAADDTLGELALEVNLLADLLADQRTRALEATALLRRVVEEIDVPLFAFDPNRVLRLVNPAGEKLLQQAAVRLLGKTADEIGLADCLDAEHEALVALPTNSSSSRWLVRQSEFRERGVPNSLIVLSDVSRALREEERGAWQRLIRVLGHELNNSLAPIKSIAGSLSSRLSETSLDPEQRRDFERGLSIIEARTASLNRFLQAYRRLAQMPPPSIKNVELLPIIERVVFLENRLAVAISPGPAVTLMVDPDQIEQMLINLLRNAVESVLDSIAADGDRKSTGESPPVTLNWVVEQRNVMITIIDRGAGLLNPSNAFVPFYTTKPAGSGLGLVLSRQIAEAHGGSIELTNLHHEKGCQVRVMLPRALEHRSNSRIKGNNNTFPKATK